MEKNRRVFQGGVYMLDLHPVRGSEQGGVRPCVCVSNDYNNYYASVALFVPLTTQDKADLPTHYHLLKKQYKFLQSDSVALGEQATTKSIERVSSFLGRLAQQDLMGVQECVKAQLELT